jgi:hypothetical protein
MPEVFHFLTETGDIGMADVEWNAGEAAAEFSGKGLEAGG